MEEEVEVSTEFNGVPQSTLKEDCLDADNSTTAVINDCLTAEVVRDDITTARVTDANGRIAVEGSPEELQNVDLKQSQSMNSGDSSVGEGNVQDHSPNFNEKLVDMEMAAVNPQSTEGDESSQKNCSNAIKAANASVHSEPQSSLDQNGSKLLHIDESSYNYSHDTNTEEVSEVSETSNAMETSDEKTEIPHAGIPGDETVTTHPSVERIPIDESANIPPVAVADPPEVLEAVSSSPTATSEGTREIPIATQAVREKDQERTESQTSFVNEYALSGNESPTYEVDRSLEQFSEILLDSDVSDSVDQAAEDNGDVAAKKKKASKKVRFADEVAQLDGRA